MIGLDRPETRDKSDKEEKKVVNRRVECDIYTDGSCVSGSGGWGFVMMRRDWVGGRNKTEWHVSGGESDTTNNRMELRAVIEAIRFSHPYKTIKIYTDSQLTLNCAQGLWKRAKNLDLWREYDKVVDERGVDVRWKWVKAHSGIEYNEIADKLALSEARGRRRGRREEEVSKIKSR